jgi:hypothetical protein
MQRRSVIALGLAAAGVAMLGGTGAAAPARSRDQGWRTILDGKSLEGWTLLGDANWSLADGTAQADTGNGYLVSNEIYGDAQIRVEFWVSDDANSGVFIRATNPLSVSTDTAYEVNIFDRRQDPAYGTGAIVNVAKVSPMPKAGGRWNLMEITTDGDRLTVVVNGVKTVDNVQDKTYARGRIALQHARGLVKFRKVEVREL